MTLLLAITNGAKWRLNSFSATCQAKIIIKYQECLKHLYAVDELCVPAFVRQNEMGDGVDEIDTIYD